MHEILKHAPFELKELSDTGEFVGIASVYGNVDLGGDVVETGAFSKTIAQRGNKVRLMDGHKVRIGVALVEETPEGLKATGKINLNKQSGAEAYSDLKFYRDNGMPMGMSIGYETIQADLAKDGVRHLKEVRLWEVTVTEFPMNEKAQVTSVKAIDALIQSLKARRAEKKDDFDTTLQEIQLYAARYQMLQALSCALSDAIYGNDDTDKTAASSEAIQQFTTAYLDMLPDFISLMAAESMEYMSRPGFELKAGRVLSQTNRDVIGKCVKDLQSLLDIEHEDEEENNDEGKSVDPQAKSGTPTGAAEQSEQADTHSAAQKTLIDSIRSLIPAA